MGMAHSVQCRFHSEDRRFHGGRDERLAELAGARAGTAAIRPNAAMAASTSSSAAFTRPARPSTRPSSSRVSAISHGAPLSSLRSTASLRAAGGLQIATGRSDEPGGELRGCAHGWCVHDSRCRRARRRGPRRRPCRSRRARTVTERGRALRQAWRGRCRRRSARSAASAASRSIHKRTRPSCASG